MQKNANAEQEGRKKGSQEKIQREAMNLLHSA